LVSGWKRSGSQFILSGSDEISIMQRPKSLVLGVGLVFAVVVLGAGFRTLTAQETHPTAEASDHSKSATPAQEAEAPTNPMKPEPTLAIWTVVVFLGLLAILTRYAWKPLMNALAERERHLEHVLMETERARNESESLLSEHRKQMSRAADEVRAILEKARQDAQSTSEQIIKLAQGEAEAAKQRAQRDIASARDQALAEIWEKTADMAVSVAGRVLSKELTDADHRRLLEAAIQAIPGAGAANGHGAKIG
jgi:F-type H+-transporting ATPase subunit b